MFHPESNPLAPKSTGPKKPEKELVEIWLGPDAAALMEDAKSETGDGDLNSKKYELTEKEKKTLWEMKRPDEVTLRNIPNWTDLPGKAIFKKDFRLTCLEEEYYKGRPLSDFIPRPEETLRSFHAKEALPHAKLFHIPDAFAKAKERGPGFRSTTKVLQAIDATGYRPATLEEMLAYARDYWKPGVDPKTLTREERELQGVDVRSIASLDSVFSDVGGGRHVPMLGWDGRERWLNAYVFENVGFLGDYSLVLRKAFPS